MRQKKLYIFLCVIFFNPSNSLDFHLAAFRRGIARVLGDGKGKYSTMTMMMARKIVMMNRLVIMMMMIRMTTRELREWSVMENVTIQL